MCICLPTRCVISTQLTQVCCVTEAGRRLRPATAELSPLFHEFDYKGSGWMLVLDNVLKLERGGEEEIRKGEWCSFGVSLPVAK